MLYAQKKTKQSRTSVVKESSLPVQSSDVIVLGNTFHTLPLEPGDQTAILSVGIKDADKVFVQQFETYGKATHYHLSWRTPEKESQEIADKLRNHKRVIVSITLPDWEMWNFRSYFSQLELDVPVVYVMFTPQQGVAALEPALRRSAAVVLAHNSRENVQKYVADALFAQAEIQGKLSEDIGLLYQAGNGGTIEPGMQAGVQPEDHGVKGYLLHRIDSLVQKGLAAKAFPGCQVMILKEGKTIYNHCFGTYSDKDTRPVATASIYDLGGVSKSAGTALAVMKLYDEKRLQLTDKVSLYLPWLNTPDKKNITIEELLHNESGMLPFIRFYREAIDDQTVTGPFTQKFVDQWHYTRMGEYTYACSDFKFKKGLVASTQTSTHTLQLGDGLWLNQSFKDNIRKTIANSETHSKRFLNSDLDFILLQQVVESIVQKPMNEYLASEFYDQMGLKRTLYHPLQRYTKPDIAPTACNDYLRRQDLCGYVLDEAAAFMGGVSGNAGLFSNAEEVGQIFQMLLNGGIWNGKRYLSEETCRLFTTAKSGNGHYGLGFDKPNRVEPLASNCSASTPTEAFGQMGSTGTCVWADPNNSLVYVFLSNRTCPDSWNAVLNDMKMRRSIQELIYQSMK